VKPAYVTKNRINNFISSAFQEDLGDGDHSTLSSVAEHSSNQAQLVMKSEGVVAGMDLAKEIFHYLDAGLEFKANLNDGDEYSFGDIAFLISGKSRSILTGERIALNCMQRMCGIATKTRHIVNLIEGTGVRLLDTRKTTPNFRMPEKWAVHIGGGTNHRYGLFDLIMLKDNHIAFAGGIRNAIEHAHIYLSENNLNLRIEIETSTLKEVEEVIKTGGVDIVMLDNMNPDLLKKCVKLIDGKFQTEASGGITEMNVREVAETGVDFISMGALTHSVSSLDMSLKAVE
jgi:nicotinate-nucleotide pyrophosphorylase (carboxylating)